MRIRTTTPQVAGEFWYNQDFSDEVVTQHELLEISVPAGRQIKLKSSVVKPEIREAEGRKVYLWRTANPSVERKRKRPAILNEKPEDPKPEAVQLSTFSGWEPIGNWYAGLLKDRVVVNPEAAAKAEEITRDAKTQEEKLRALYQFVSTRFRYVSLSFGTGRFQPHMAADVLGNEYGDCKDKHTLLASLLKATGIESAAVLVNSAKKIDHDVPSPGQFDHVITLARIGTREYFLDTTPEVAPFEYLLPGVRGEEGLLIAENASRLQALPDKLPNATAITFNIDAKLSSDGTLKGKVQRTLRGDGEIAARIGFRRTSRSQWQELAQAISYATGYGGEVDEVEADRPENTSKPFGFSYVYTRKDFGDWENKRVYTAMPPGFGIEVSGSVTEKPQRAIVLGEPGEVLYTSTLEAPEGYAIEKPEDFSLTQDFAEYTAVYVMRGNVLHGQRRLKIKKKEVPPERWEDFKKFSKELNEEENAWLTLRDLKASTTDIKVSEQDKLFQKARQAYERRDLQEAQDLLEQLRKLNAEYAGLYIAHGQMKIMQGDTSGGIQDFHREIQHHPTDEKAYQYLAFFHQQRGELYFSEKTWRELLSHDANNLTAQMELGTLLAKLGRTEEALVYLDASAKRAPDNPWLLAQAGVVYLKVGRSEEGKKALDRAVEIEGSATMKNNLAYLLAEANLDLGRAKELALDAVERTELASAETSLEKLTTGQLQRVHGLATYWDTLGWVYFQMHEDAQAEQYLGAAWRLSQSAPVAEHLARLYERQGRKADALHMYRLALAGPHLENRETIEAKVRRLEGPTARRPAKMPAGLRQFRLESSAGEELSKLRTVRLPRFEKEKGTAEYWLLLAPKGKVEDVRLIRGSENMRAAAEHLKSATYQSYFPAQSQAKIVRRSIVMCTEIPAECNAVLMIPETVTTVD